MKKLITIILTGLLVLLLCSCGEKAEDEYSLEFLIDHPTAQEVIDIFGTPDSDYINPDFSGRKIMYHEGIECFGYDGFLWVSYDRESEEEVFKNALWQADFGDTEKNTVKKVEKIVNMLDKRYGEHTIINDYMYEWTANNGNIVRMGWTENGIDIMFGQ